MKYRVVTHFETLYTHEKEEKVEYTDDRMKAIYGFELYIENPEVKFCSVDIVNKEGDPCKKIILCYAP